jgi:glycosyltransferase involved in cell wall biosynthesis
MTAPLAGLTAVIPALNEAMTIQAVVCRALTVAGRVLVVDDGSTDGTGELARQAGAQVLRHDRPKGYDAAIAAGLNEAFRTGAQAATTLDADGQHRVEDLLRISSPVVSGEVLYCAGLRDAYNRPVEGLIGLLARPLYGTRDPFCGLKCYHRDLFERCGPFPEAMYVGSLPLAWVRRLQLPRRFIQIEAQPRVDQPRFGPILRASAKLAVAFLRTLAADFSYRSSSLRA